MKKLADYIWHNGEMVDYEKATIHFLNSSFHYGTGVFEGIRSYQTVKGPAIFRLEDHLKRLEKSAHILGFDELPFSLEEMTKACEEVVLINNLQNSYIRPMLYISEGGWGLTLKDIKLGFSVAAWKWENYMGDEAKARGVRAMVSSFSRHHINSAMTKAKICGHYVNSVLAKTHAHRAGLDEAIFLDPQGLVSECSGQNIFLVKDQKIVTPPDYSILSGITRDTVFQLNKYLGFDLSEGNITRDQLYTADEVFMVGTANEVVGISEIDYRKIGSGLPGPITKVFQEEYENLVQGKFERFSHFLTPLLSKPSVNITHDKASGDHHERYL